jgi:hypothetical protein
LHVASAWISSWGSNTLRGTRWSLIPLTCQGVQEVGMTINKNMFWYVLMETVYN